MTLEAMESTLARLDAMIGVLKKQMQDGAADGREISPGHRSVPALARRPRCSDQLGTDQVAHRLFAWSYREIDGAQNSSSGEKHPRLKHRPMPMHAMTPLRRCRVSHVADNPTLLTPLDVCLFPLKGS
jgi:hypothetical protein